MYTATHGVFEMGVYIQKHDFKLDTGKTDRYTLCNTKMFHVKQS